VCGSLRAKRTTPTSTDQRRRILRICASAISHEALPAARTDLPSSTTELIEAVDKGRILALAAAIADGMSVPDGSMFGTGRVDVWSIDIAGEIIRTFIVDPSWYDEGRHRRATGDRCPALGRRRMRRSGTIVAFDNNVRTQKTTGAVIAKLRQ
jgi:hypothetical protein